MLVDVSSHTTVKGTLPAMPPAPRTPAISAQTAAILDGLDSQQRRAVLAPRGPVCILAGAGTGKTRTITRRIGYLVAQGHVRADQVLAVTFTSRAAGELRSRLANLGTLQAGTGQVQARTFHAAALRNLRYFWPRVYGDTPWQLLDNKFRAVAQAARQLGVDSTTETLRDLIAEIDWAKASRITPDGYVVAATRRQRETPLAVAQVADVYNTYEELKVAGEVRMLDFDDLLSYMATALEEDQSVATEFRDRYRCFVVDEFQDITPSQFRLLQAWLGRRDDLTVVGDANQTIYTFAGAEPDYLLGFGRRFDNATVIKLESDYRSTPQIVDFANDIIADGSDRFRASGLTLRGMRSDGPLPQLAEYPDEDQEAAGVASEIAALIAAGVPAAEIAVLYRVNSQSERIEAALDAHNIGYLVKGGEGFFERAEIKQAMTLLTRLATNPDIAGADNSAAAVATRIRGALHPVGLTEAEPAGEQAKERWRALTALADLAEELSQETADPHSGDGFRNLAATVTALRERAAARHAPATDGVTLATLHAAKGLEWDAVFLIGGHEGNLPISHAIKRGPEAIEEERRLLYVGVTRARTHLYFSWALARNPGGRATRSPSSFLDKVMPEELRTAPAHLPGQKRRKGACSQCGGDVPSERGGFALCEDCASSADFELFERLRAWRRDTVDEGKPVYTVFGNETLALIARARPRTVRELGRIKGVGSHKLDLYGEAVLAIIAQH